MKRFFAVFICSALFFSGCSKKEDKPVSNVDEVEKKEETVYVDPYEGMEKNPLTGIYIDEETAARRPVAVMINNHKKALPQSGISEADILYEALAEGEITRLVAVFQELTADKIGPVRSARDYYTYLALDNDAIYIHHGGSPTGYSAISNRNIDNMDGMKGGDAFFRDTERMNQPGMYEHSSYVSAEGIFSQWEDSGYRMEKNEDFVPMFKFFDTDITYTQYEDAKSIELPYSYYQITQFNYNEDTKEYERYQNGSPHIDAENGKTLSFKNVIVQYANMYVIAGDEAGRRNIDLVGSGTGLYFSNGKVMEITWKKDSYQSPTKWYDDAGNELYLNKGKTCICIFSKNEAVNFQ